MEKESLRFVKFDIVYTRQGLSNKWTRKVDSRASAKQKSGVSMFTILHEDESVKDEKRIRSTVTVECDPLMNDANTFTVPENWKPYEREAIILTDKAFKERHPEAEL